MSSNYHQVLLVASISKSELLILAIVSIIAVLVVMKLLQLKTIGKSWHKSIRIFLYIILGAIGINQIAYLATKGTVNSIWASINQSAQEQDETNTNSEDNGYFAKHPSPYINNDNNKGDNNQPSKQNNNAVSSTNNEETEPADLEEAIKGLEILKSTLQKISRSDIEEESSMTAPCEIYIHRTGTLNSYNVLYQEYRAYYTMHSSTIEKKLSGQTSSFEYGLTNKISTQEEKVRLAKMACN